jgi:hypothetical protein
MAFQGPARPYNTTTRIVKCYLRYQWCDIQRGDPVILCASSNGATGTTVLVLQENKLPGTQSYLKVIGVLDNRHSEMINDIARPQHSANNMFANPRDWGARSVQGRGGPRVGARGPPDVEYATIAQNSPEYINEYPPDYGRLPTGQKPFVWIEAVMRTPI